MNSTFEKLFGYLGKDVIGKRFGDLSKIDKMKPDVIESINTRTQNGKVSRKKTIIQCIIRLYIICEPLFSSYNCLEEEYYAESGDDADNNGDGEDNNNHEDDEKYIYIYIYRRRTETKNYRRIFVCSTGMVCATSDARMARLYHRSVASFQF